MVDGLFPLLMASRTAVLETSLMPDILSRKTTDFASFIIVGVAVAVVGAVDEILGTTTEIRRFQNLVSAYPFTTN